MYMNEYRRLAKNIMAAQTPFFPPNAIRVCIDEKINNAPQGRIYGTMLSEPLTFTDSANFLLQVDGIFDRQGFPQSFQTKRSFQEQDIHQASFNLKPPRVSESNKIINVFGKLKTFDITVTTRQNASWQGKISTPDGEQNTPFASELELLKLMLSDDELTNLQARC